LDDTWLLLGPNQQLGDLTLTAETLAAVVGTSAGVGSMAGGWAALWWRDHVPTSQRQLLHWVYVHVDDLLGATKTENIRRANRRFRLNRRLWFLPRPTRQAIADFFFFVPQYGGVTALPAPKRMARYVTLELGGGQVRRWFPRPFQAWNIQAVEVKPTSEANFLGEGYPGIVARKVAQAMRLTGTDQLEVASHPELGYIRYTRKGPAPEFRPVVPHEVSADA
jgi:hypothetical protein